MIPYVVSCPVTWCAEHEVGWEQVYLRAGREVTAGQLVELLAAWRAVTRIRRLELFGLDELDRVLEAVGPGVRVVVGVDAAEAERLEPARRARWLEREVNLWARPRADDRADVLEQVRRASLAGWPVTMPPAPWLLDAGEGLLELLDHYLFCAELTVAVEPFHALLVSLLRRQRRSLWNMWFGVPRDHFHLAPDGRVSLHARWAADDATCYGQASEPVDVWRSSQAHRRLLHLWKRFPHPDTPCVGCPGRRPCGGVLLALDPTFDCTWWRELFERLRLAAARLQRGRS